MQSNLIKSMKSLTWKLILPLAVILFFSFSRWVCAKVVDAPNSILQGFPLPYTCPGWGSSMSIQFFVAEFVIDLLVYFFFFFIAIYLVNRFICRVRVHKVAVITLYIIAGFALSLQVLMYSIDTTFYLHRSFDIKIIQSTYGFFWQNRPDCF